MAHSLIPTRKNTAECTIPEAEAISPYTPLPSSHALPVEPTRAKAVMVVPNTLMSSRNGPMDRSATKKSADVPRNRRLERTPRPISSSR